MMQPSCLSLLAAPDAPSVLPYCVSCFLDASSRSLFAFSCFLIALFCFSCFLVVLFKATLLSIQI